MKVALHGTSYDSAMRIVLEGYNSIKTNWLASDKNYCYGIDYDSVELDSYYTFRQSIYQGLSACISQNSTLKPSVLIINIDGKEYTEDRSNTFDKRYKPIQISNVTKEDIVGWYSIENNLDNFKILIYKQIIDKCCSLNFDMDERTKEVVDSIEHFQFKQDSIKRKVVELRKYDGISIPDEIIL